MRSFYLFLFLCSGMMAVAQQSRQYSFKQFSVTNGLASNAVSRIVQDREGYMWMATTNGLQRYDGSSFITFKAKTNDPKSIPSNHLRQLYVDRHGRLWVVGENEKMGIFDTRTFHFKEVPLTGQTRRLLIFQSFFELPTGELVMLKDDGGLIRYSESENKMVQAHDLLPSPKGWTRNWIQWDANLKKYWMSCDSGLVQYDPATKHLNYRGHNIDKDPVISAFETTIGTTRVFTDARNNVSFIQWLPPAPQPTIYRYVRRLGKVEVLYSGLKFYHEVNYFLQQRSGRLWMYGKPFIAEWTDRNGVSFMQHIPNEYRSEHSINFDLMFHAYEDKEGNVWLSTDNGVFLFNPEAQIFTTYRIARPDGKPPFDAPVQAVEELPDGRIFVGCWGGAGLTSYDREFNPIPLPSPFPTGELSVWDMAVNARTSDLWVTMQGGNIVVLDAKTKKFTRYQPEVFGRSTIRQVDEDTSGNLWFGTHNGRVVKWDIKKSGNDPSKGYELILQAGLVHKIHYDYQGFIWVATLDHGLIKIDAKTHKVVKIFSSKGKEGERMFSDAPRDMTYYNDSTLIVADGCINIINTRTNKVTFLTTEDGLPSHTTESVERDKNGILWIGMTNGICRLNLEKKLISYYDRRDGITYDKFEMAGVRELSDGRLVYNTDHNFMVFDPKKFGQQYMPPRPQITAFKLAGNSLSLDSVQKEGRAILKYNNTSIAISFSALSYLQQQKVQYYYMLENLDNDWIKTDRPIEVAYSFLPPGNYTFKVKSENADGITNPEIATFTVIVRAPVWRTWWFYSLIALLVIAVLYMLDRERMKRRKSMQQIRSQIAKNLTTEVSTTLNNINVLSEIAKIKADKDIEQSKVFIDQISDKSRHMIEAMDDTLWSIDPRNDSMKQTVLRIKELTEGFRTETGVEIDLIVDNKIQSLELDMKLRHELYFFYKEAVSYLLEHLECEQMFVNLNKVRGRLLMEILCECEGTDSATERGFRQAVGNRVKSMPGNIDIIADLKSFSVVLYVELK